MRLGRFGAVLVAVSCSAAMAAPGRHAIEVELDPAGHALRVADRLSFDEAWLGARDRSIVFLLHEGLAPKSETPGARLTPLGRAPRGADFAISEDRFTPPKSVPVEGWRLSVPPGVIEVSISYGGTIDHPVAERAEDYARSFGETPGTIGEEGVFLAGASYWVPWLGEGAFPFTLDARLPSGWEAVSQGTRALHEQAPSGARVRWESKEPQTEIYLVAAKLVVTSRRFGKVEAMAFLRADDPALAAKYLEATGRYLAMYETLLGPYPYGKFALVENFWETGYGMPSFTLLGSKVIRLPFIIGSSYPHEILHNWWGNGVFVDYAAGNWCEGLTAYLADHLLQEQQGSGADYRLTTLQKYTDYVSKGKDFPLSEFRERHSPATEAVGYGKALMFFHMLRRELGDATFSRGLRSFYDRNRFREASFGDLRVAFEEAAGRNLGVTFEQAIARPGAPQLVVEGVKTARRESGWELAGSIDQLQKGPPWKVDVRLAVTMEGREAAWEGVVPLTAASTGFVLEELPAKPIRLDVDPAFDLFRKLDPAETPPALSGAFGAERALVILPSAAPADLLEAYRALAADWAKGEPGRLSVKLDSEVAELPREGAVWLFGWENRLAPAAGKSVAVYGAAITPERVRLEGRDLARSDHAAAVVARDPAHPGLALAWVAADRASQIAGLGRKLPHYHKYSFLVFEGDEPVNVVKGRWPVVGSPLTVALDGGTPLPERGRLAPRPALATLPPAFSRDRLRGTVELLASDSFAGRAAGSAGADAAADHLVTAFREAGLKPAGDEGGFVQSWTARIGGREVTLRNVLGAIPGTKAELAGQSIVVAAHYDHLGDGRFDVRAGNEGKVHPGADDNASGVAVLVELARAFAAGPSPDRTIVFAAFTGEEAGLLGSRRFVASLGREGAGQVRGAVNLDTVGRLGAGKLLVLGTGTASEWVHIARGAGFVTGVPVEGVAKDPGGSDQVAFHEAGVPAVQLFTGAHGDYHSPGDTPDKVDLDGLVKVAAVAREFVEYLAGRAEPLTVTLTGGAAAPRAAANSGRRVSIGVVPDFAFPGPGVRLGGVVPGSPAEKAGLAEGDVLVKVGDAEVRDLSGYSEALKGFTPGAKVRLVVRRGEKEMAVEVEAAAR